LKVAVPDFGSEMNDKAQETISSVFSKASKTLPNSMLAKAEAAYHDGRWTASEIEKLALETSEGSDSKAEDEV
jgi:hypothetical protein